MLWLENETETRAMHGLHKVFQKVIAEARIRDRAEPEDPFVELERGKKPSLNSVQKT